MTIKLTPRQIEVIEFCEDPKLVEEIAERFQIHTRSVYPCLRSLIIGGFIKAESGHMNAQRKSVKIFYSIKSADQSSLNHEDALYGIKKINMDFVRSAHNPFNLGVRHG